MNIHSNYAMDEIVMPKDETKKKKQAAHDDLRRGSIMVGSPSWGRYGSLTTAGAARIRKKWYKRIFKFLDYPHRSERRGFSWDNTRDFLFIPEILSARRHIFAETVSLAAVASGAAFFLIWSFSRLLALPVLSVISGGIALFYFILMVFKIYVVFQSLEYPFMEISGEKIRGLKNEDLPVYTILIPLYRESMVIGQIIKAMSAIDYPVDKLDIIITLEEYDRETIGAIEAARPPAHFKTLILPNVKPKTKPKALNVAFTKTLGEFLVIYDAEIVPDPDQLKKAVIAFRENPEVACFQTRLDHYNPNQSVLTKLFNAEFSFYYDLFLPGLQKLKFPIPLSGHSTHFRRNALSKIGAWDPYNVTEDCDLGMRLYRGGFTAEVLNSTSREEATSTLSAWIPQRTRWMKGFLQTSIVHLRHPYRFKNELGGWKKLFAFLLIVPGTTIVNAVNLIFWVMLAVWLLFHPPIIQSFFPGPVLFVSIVSFITGSLVFTYLNLISAYKRGRFSLVKYSILSPVYWILLAYATMRSVFQLITSPHSWEKTAHGSHLQNDGK